jgi:energy-coupling factor transporter transmembrane protein EcfT
LRSTVNIPFFQPRETGLHKLYPLFKMILVLFYILLIVSNSNLIFLICILLMALSLYLVLRLPLQSMMILSAAAVACLVLIVFFTQANNVWGRLIIAAGKMLTISFLVMLFSLTTQPNEIFQFLKPSSFLFKTIQPVIYILMTILAVFPSIQYDLFRAMDAEALRMGKRVMFYHVTSWLSILTVVLVRTLNRVERFTDTVIDRGYIPAEGLRPLKPRRVEFSDFLVLLACILPGLVFWMVLK